jgi:hypothetical protein
MLEDVYEIRMLGPPYIAGLDSTFTKTEVKEFIMKTKITKPKVMLESQPSSGRYFASGVMELKP